MLLVDWERPVLREIPIEQTQTNNPANSPESQGGAWHNS
jgi:hypothetical protein